MQPKEGYMGEGWTLYSNTKEHNHATFSSVAFLINNASLFHEGKYNYNGEEYDATASPEGTAYDKCREEISMALKLNSPCTTKNCTFSDVWNGSGGAGQDTLYAASFFYGKATQVGWVDKGAPSAKSSPAAFRDTAEKVCPLSVREAKAAYPGLLDVPYACMDLVYEYTLLVDGFGLAPTKEITLVEKVKHGEYLIKATWPLGEAIEAVAPKKGLRDFYDNPPAVGR